MSPRRIRFAVLASAASFALSTSAQDSADPGKAMVDATCNSCHPLSARVGTGYTPEGWDTVLRMMQNHGALPFPLFARQPLMCYVSACRYVG